MSWLVKIEKALFYFFVAVFFCQWRLIWPPELSSTLPAGGSFNEWTAFFIYATDLIIAAIFILWLVRFILSFVKGAPRSGEGFKSSALIFRPNTFLYLFLLFCALSLFVAADKGLAVFRFIKLLEFIGLYFYIRYNFAALYNLKRFWQWFIAGAALQSLAAIAQFLTQQSLGLKFFAESPLSPNIDGVAKIVVSGEKIIRAYGLVPHPNILAAMLSVALFGLAWLFIFSHSERSEEFRGSVATRATDPSASTPLGFRMTKRGVILGIVFIVLSIALFFTFSRGVIAVGSVLFLIWLAYLWHSSKEFRKPIVLICILLFSVSCFLLLIFGPYASARYDLADLPESQAVNLRLFYNQAALDFIKTNPWLGAGQGNFTVALRASAALPDWQYQPAHNIYLLVAAENGLPALLAFLAFLFLTLRAAWHHRKELGVSILLFTVACLLLTGFFDHFLWDLQQGQILFWLVLGLLMASTDKKYAEKI